MATDPEQKTLALAVRILDDAPGYAVEPLTVLVQALPAEQIDAARRLLSAAAKLDDDARMRVADYLRSRFGEGEG